MHAGQSINKRIFVKIWAINSNTLSDISDTESAGNPDIKLPILSQDRGESQLPLRHSRSRWMNIFKLTSSHFDPATSNMAAHILTITLLALTGN